MKVSKTSIYAIRLIVRLAKEDNGNLFMVEDLAREENVPKHYAAKILQRLAKYEYVDSFKGRGGGFRVNASSWNLTLYELIELLDGRIKFDHCFFEFFGCTVDKPCSFCKEWKFISSQISELLMRFKVADLAKEKSTNEVFEKIKRLKPSVNYLTN